MPYSFFFNDLWLAAEVPLMAIFFGQTLELWYAACLC